MYKREKYKFLIQLITTSTFIKHFSKKYDHFRMIHVIPEFLFLVCDTIIRDHSIPRIIEVIIETIKNVFLLIIGHSAIHSSIRFRGECEQLICKDLQL